ncbi:hypothetical protein SNE40_016397 [Patella caerulea]
MLPLRSVILSHQSFMLQHQFIMLPHQSIMLPHQFIMLPHQSIMLPNQFIMLPHQSIMLPYYFFMLPHQSIMLQHWYIVLQHCYLISPSSYYIGSCFLHVTFYVTSFVQPVTTLLYQTASLVQVTSSDHDNNPSCYHVLCYINCT